MERNIYKIGEKKLKIGKKIHLLQETRIKRALDDPLIYLDRSYNKILGLGQSPASLGD